MPFIYKNDTRFENRKFTVYSHKSPEGKIYYGTTCQSLSQRFRGGKSYIKSCVRSGFSSDIQKFGWDNFEHSIIATNLSLNDALELEEKLILECPKELSYNVCANSVDRHDLSLDEEHKEIVSKSISKYWKEHYYEAYSNVKRGIREDIPSRYDDRKIEAMKKKGFNGCSSPKCKPVNQYTMDGKFIRRYNSITEAYMATRINDGTIAKCCKKDRGLKSAGGYRWEYADV